jgi:uncharacterized protein YjhX (UPF0386 family)
MLSLPLVYLAGVSNESGRIGDTFGILNSFFSALGFGAVVYTLIQQSKIVQHQEQEVRIDRFESKFFQMLSAQREIVRDIDLKKNIQSKNGSPTRVITTKGRECFRIIYNEQFKKEIRAYYIDQHGNLSTDSELLNLCTLRELIYIYEYKLFPKYQDDLGHYFRHLYRIVQLIDKSDFVQDKTEYIGLLRAQMSMYEHLLLFYNGLSKYGTKFKPLIEKYSVLESISEGYLINGSYDICASESYSPTAFEKK